MALAGSEAVAGNLLVADAEDKLADYKGPRHLAAAGKIAAHHIEAVEAED